MVAAGLGHFFVAFAGTPRLLGFFRRLNARTVDPGALLGGAVGAGQVEGGVDQTDVREGLRKVADQAAVGRSLAAQALARLAALEVKQKQLDQARQTIARLKAEYPEQKYAIAKAVALLPNNAQKSSLAGGEHNERPLQTDHIPTVEEKSQAAEFANKGWQLYRAGKNENAAATRATALSKP